MERFYEDWMARQEELLQELLAVPRDAPDIHDLINRTLTLYKSYYQERSHLADRDILLVYNPVWLTPFERIFLWIAGWKPSLALRILRGSSTAPLCPLQETAVGELETEIAMEERQLTMEMMRLQEAVAMPQVLMLASRMADIRNGEARAEAEAVVEPLLSSLRFLLQCADNLRAKVVRKLLEVLSPMQTVEFLSAAGELHLRIRRWGMQHRQDGRAT